MEDTWGCSLPFAFFLNLLQEAPETTSPYKVFRLSEQDRADWVKDLELESAQGFQPPGQRITTPPKILVLYGSLRERAYSRLLAYEFARILDLLGKHLGCLMLLKIRKAPKAGLTLGNRLIVFLNNFLNNNTFSIVGVWIEVW